jgi:methylmalonyl-CoA mutase cobalamin-binding subunit
LTDAAEDLEFTSMAALLTDLIAAAGPVSAWTSVLGPVLRTLGSRWMGGETCFEAEWALTDEISTALEQYSKPLQKTMSGRPVLLASCPDERHSLPMEVLRAALADHGIPSVLLRQMVPEETTIGMAAKLDAVLVVLWSMSASTADNLLAQRLRREGLDVCVAGPGWARYADLSVPWVNDVLGAVTAVTALAR